MFPSPLVRCLDQLLAATRFQPKGASLCCGGVAATPARSTRLHFIVCDLPRVVKPPGVFFVLWQVLICICRVQNSERKLCALQILYNEKEYNDESNWFPQVLFQGE